MKLSHLACCCALLLSSPLLHAGDPFAELDAAVMESQAPQAIKQAEFEAFVAEYLGEYQVWRSAYLKEFDQYRAEVIAKWGDGLVSDSLVTVDYSQDKETRTVVDLDKNEAIVEVLVAADTSVEQAQAQVEAAVAKVVKEDTSVLSQTLDSTTVIPEGNIIEKTVDYGQSVEKTAKAVIVKQAKSQLQELDQQAESLTASVPDVGNNIVETVTQQQKQQVLEETQKRIDELEKTYGNARDNALALTEKKVIQYRIKLPANGTSKRAEKFVGFAEKESERFDVPAALVMAIMHSESSFNPQAKSPIPAYGLMQIVPRTAGWDVNAKVRKKNEPMTSSELYQPETNVETGAAYLNILDKSYLKAITNPESRLYCVIAAYNTGAGNVAKAFNKDGARNVRKAAVIINTLSPDQVYQHLVDHLPYDETRTYLKKVNDRISLYEKHND